MRIMENVSLKLYSTMRLGGTARYVSEVHTKDELLAALEWARQRDLSVMMIGAGSNIIWKDEGFTGLLLISKFAGFKALPDHHYKIGAGENWDRTVKHSVKLGLSGIEFLSLIPGTVGATPVQNVGAYGAEIADVFVELEAFDLHEKKFVTIRAKDCDFGYRSSRFKKADHGRFFITSVTLKLKPGKPEPPFYEALQAYFDSHDINNFTSKTIREAVIDIRTSKLPDPNKIPNNGSFFANPIISYGAYDKLLANHPDIKAWKLPDGSVKISAAWLVEKAGYKDFHDNQTGMATWKFQPLVLVNENAKKTIDLLLFRQKIIDRIHNLFDIKLEQEPELLP